MDSKKHGGGRRKGGRQEEKRNKDCYCRKELMMIARQKQQWKKSEFWVPATYFRHQNLATYYIRHLNHHQTEVYSNPSF
jgi:hypothetical protein